MKSVRKNMNLKIPTFDSENTKVLLIGVSNYPEDNSINNIPNVKQNIKDLNKIFINKNFIGVPKENITISLNENKLEIERKLANISTNAKFSDTLIVYYSGHGIISTEDFNLYLTTKNSTKITLDIDSINIKKFQELISRSKANKKIVIIDACHSGQIHNHMDDISSKINIELNKFEGTYVLTSATEDEPSLFPWENENAPTYFTGCLIDTIKNGLENNNQYCNLREIYNEVTEKLNKIGNMPKPQQSIYKNADEILFCKNVKFQFKTDEDLLWEKVLILHKKDLYKQFLSIYPESKYKLRAENLLMLFNENKTRSRKNNSKLNVIENSNTNKFSRIRFFLVRLILSAFLSIVFEISEKVLSTMPNDIIINNKVEQLKSIIK